MNNYKYIYIAFLTLLLLVSACSKTMYYKSVDSQSLCSTKGGYWYNNKCWKEFEDDGIPESKIDSIVYSQMKIIEKSIFTIDSKVYPLVAFLPLEEDDGMLFITVYGTVGDYKTVVFPTGKKKLKNEPFDCPVMLLDGDAISGDVDKDGSRLKGKATINIIDIDNLEIEIRGSVSDSGKDLDFSFTTNEAIVGAGNSHIEVKEDEAYLSGGLGTVTYSQIKKLVKSNPNVKTIVMTHISGSINDAVNMHTGRLLHENGFTTKVLFNSDIASGGVDLFCAGNNRIVEKGAKIGVHSWCCIDGLTAIEIPKDHPAHKYQLDYFKMALGPEKGPAFYFYTLSASPFDGVHYMSDKEIKEWGIATQFIEK